MFWYAIFISRPKPKNHKGTFFHLRETQRLAIFVALFFLSTRQREVRRQLLTSLWQLSFHFSLYFAQQTEKSEKKTSSLQSFVQTGRKGIPISYAYGASSPICFFLFIELRSCREKEEGRGDQEWELAGCGEEEFQPLPPVVVYIALFSRYLFSPWVYLKLLLNLIVSDNSII